MPARMCGWFGNLRRSPPLNIHASTTTDAHTSTEEQIHAVVRDGVVQKIEHGFQYFACIQVHIASGVQAFASLMTGSMILARSAGFFRIRSNSLKGGSSTCARRAYARWIALLLWPSASCANRSG